MLEKKFQDQDKYLLRANSCVAGLRSISRVGKVSRKT